MGNIEDGKGLEGGGVKENSGRRNGVEPGKQSFWYHRSSTERPTIIRMNGTLGSNHRDRGSGKGRRAIFLTSWKSRCSAERTKQKQAHYKGKGRKKRAAKSS